MVIVILQVEDSERGTWVTEFGTEVVAYDGSTKRLPNTDFILHEYAPVIAAAEGRVSLLEQERPNDWAIGVTSMNDPDFFVGYDHLVNPRVVLFDPKWNPKGVTFQEYYSDAAAAVEVQLQFMEYQRQYLHHYCDHPLGRPAEWEFYVDNQNTYDSAYFGAELVFREGQVVDVAPPLAGRGKDRIFEMDIDHPLENPFVRTTVLL